MIRCIYCSESKDSSDFNREHVLPSAFGSFQGALVLREAVCSSCNSFFGGDLDLILARGSEEGLQRYLYGVRPPEQIGHFRYDTLSVTYAESDDYEGAILRLEPDPSAPRGIKAVPADQVGFARADGTGFEWFPLADVYEGAWKERDDLDWQQGVKVYAAEPQAVRDFLEREGIAHPKWRQMVRSFEPGEEVTVHQISELSSEILRVMAKISFNYLSHVHGAQFALRPEFDAIRRYVRFSEEPGHTVVRADTEEIFRPLGDTPEGMRPVMHTLTIERPLNADVVLGQVCLFGGLRYEVLLSPHPVPDLIYSGHVYNLADRQIYELGNRRQPDRADVAL